jgi:hypothetical protein
MSNINLVQAIEIAEHYLNESVKDPHDPVQGDRWVVSKEKIIDCDEYWIFHYQSAMYLSTENPSYSLAGNLPLRVSKKGEVLGFGKG